MWGSFFSSEKENGPNAADLKGELASLGLDVDTSFMEPPDDIPQFDEAHLASVLATAMTDPDDKDIELTANDLSDTNLLSELSGLLGVVEDGQKKLSEVEAKIRQGKTKCLQEKKAGRMESAKTIYMEVMQLEKEASDLRAKMQKTSSGFQLEPSVIPATETTQPRHIPRENVPEQKAVVPEAKPEPKQVTHPTPPAVKRHSDEGFGALEAMMDTGDEIQYKKAQESEAPRDIQPAAPQNQPAKQQSPPPATIPQKRESDDGFGALEAMMDTEGTVPSKRLDEGSSSAPVPEVKSDVEDTIMADSSVEKIEPMDTETPSGPVMMDLLGIPVATPEPPLSAVVEQPEPPQPKEIQQTTPTKTDQNQSLVKEIHRRILGCKVVAKQYRDIGDKGQGLACLRVMKGLEKILKEIEEGEEHTIESLPKVPVFENQVGTQVKTSPTPSTAVKPPSRANESNQTPKSEASPTTTTTTTTTNPTMSPAELAKRTHTLEMLEAALKKQIDSYVERAKKAEKEGDRKTAVSFLRLKKVWTQDLEKIADQKKHPFIPPPQYHFEDIETKREVINNDLSPHHLEIQLQDLKHVKPPDGYDSLSLYIIAEFAYPNEETKQTFRTDPIPVNGPAFSTKLDVTKLLKIERKKSLEIFIRNKKIVLNLWHARGWLFRDVAVGRVEVKLNPLAEQSTFVYDTDILEGRKPTGGMVTVQLRLRTPVSKPEVEVTKDRILFIDKHCTFEDALALQEAELQQKQQKEQQRVQAEQKVEQKAKQRQEPTTSTQPPPAEAKQAKPKQEPAVQPKAEPEKPKLPDTDSVDWIVSNYVLEMEIKEITEIIEKSKSNPDADVLDLQIRLQLLNLQISRIFELITTGQLTQEVYVQMLKNKIEEEKNAAKLFVAAGKKKKAMEALKRAKWMEEEMSGC